MMLRYLLIMLVQFIHYEVSEKSQSHLVIVILPKQLRLVSLNFDNFNDALNLNKITVKIYDMFNIFQESVFVLYSY